MKKIQILVAFVVFFGVMSCRDSTSSQEEKEQERIVQKIDSLEREFDDINKKMDSISREASQTVEELN
ncbi:MAG: hypothetical protein R6V36_08505 [Psychroflexus sp.]